MRDSVFRDKRPYLILTSRELIRQSRPIIIHCSALPLTNRRYRRLVPLSLPLNSTTKTDINAHTSRWCINTAKGCWWHGTCNGFDERQRVFDCTFCRPKPTNQLCVFRSRSGLFNRQTLPHVIETKNYLIRACSCVKCESRYLICFYLQFIWNV